MKPADSDETYRRITVTVPRSVWDRVQRYQEAKALSRSAAVCELVRWGDEAYQETTKNPRRKK